MKWEPTLEMMQAYVLVMSEEQYDRFETALLEGRVIFPFTMREVYELETKLNEKKERDNS